MRLLLLSITFACLFLQGCQDDKQPQVNMEDIEDELSVEVSQEDSSYLTVELKNSDGIQVGEAVLSESDQGVKITTEAENITPGLHGYHIHEYGVCEGPTFETAGGHFNPDDKKHGFDHEDGPHAGDLPNLTIQDDGTVKDEYVNDRVTLKKGVENSLRGTHGSTLIIHAEADDYISQPAGDAGDRVVCGVISKPQKK